MASAAGATGNFQRVGYMWKLPMDTPTGEKWKFRLFMVKDGYLLYYDSKKSSTDSHFDNKPRGVVPLGKCTIDVIQRGPKNSGLHGIKIVHPAFPPGHCLVLCAESKSEQSAWVEVFKQAASVTLESVHQRDGKISELEKLGADKQIEHDRALARLQEQTPTPLASPASESQSGVLRRLEEANAELRETQVRMDGELTAAKKAAAAATAELEDARTRLQAEQAAKAEAASHADAAAALRTELAEAAQARERLEGELAAAKTAAAAAAATTTEPAAADDRLQRALDEIAFLRSHIGRLNEQMAGKPLDGGDDEGNGEEDNESAGPLGTEDARKAFAEDAQDTLRQQQAAADKAYRAFEAKCAQQLASADAPQPTLKRDDGSIDVDVSWCWGDKQRLLEPSPDALRAHLVLDASGKTAQLQDTSVQDSEHTVVQLFMALGADVSDEEVAGALGPLNAYLCELCEAAKGDGLPFTRVTVVGPLPLPAPDSDSGRCIAVEVYLGQDLMAPIVQKLQELDQDADGVAALVQQLLQRFEVTLASSLSLQQLLGQSAAEAASSSTQFSVDGKLGKGVLAVLQEVASKLMFVHTSSSFSAEACMPFSAVQHAGALRNVTLHAQVSDEDRLASAAATAMCYLDDRHDFLPERMAAEMAPCVGPMAALRTALVRGMASMLQSVRLDEAAEAAAEGDAPPDALSEVLYLLSGAPEGFATAGDAQDHSQDAFQRGMRVTAWAGQWFIANASQVHSIRVAGCGLGAHVRLHGVDLAPLAKCAHALLRTALEMQTNVPPGEDGPSEAHVKMRTPVVLLAGADPALLDAAMAWAATSGTKEDDVKVMQREGVNRRVLVLPSGNAAVFDLPNEGWHEWRAALAAGNADELVTAYQKDGLLRRLWTDLTSKLRHKPRCVSLGVLRASDVPQLLSGQPEGDESTPSTAVQLTSQVMRSMLVGWEEEMEVQRAVADGAEKRQRLQPWAAVLVHEDEPVCAAGKAKAADILRGALALPESVGELHVVFASVASGANLLHGMDGLVSAAVGDHEATMGVFGPEDTR